MLRRTRYRKLYRTLDGQADYAFDLVRVSPDCWRVYIESSPDYRGRDDSAYVTHRLRDLAGRRYVCWASDLQSLDDALRVAARWADATEAYIATGARF